MENLKLQTLDVYENHIYKRNMFPKNKPIAMIDKFVSQYSRNIEEKFAKSYSFAIDEHYSFLSQITNESHKQEFFLDTQPWYIRVIYSLLIGHIIRLFHGRPHWLYVKDNLDYLAKQIKIEGERVEKIAAEARGEGGAALADIKVLFADCFQNIFDKIINQHENLVTEIREAKESLKTIRSEIDIVLEELRVLNIDIVDYENFQSVDTEKDPEKNSLGPLRNDIRLKLSQAMSVFSNFFHEHFDHKSKFMANSKLTNGNKAQEVSLWQMFNFFILSTGSTLKVNEHTRTNFYKIIEKSKYNSRSEKIFFKRIFDKK
jgi:hypothetical protein